MRTEPTLIAFVKCFIGIRITRDRSRLTPLEHLKEAERELAVLGVCFQGVDENDAVQRERLAA
jgi:hypothetical protein